MPAEIEGERDDVFDLVKLATKTVAPFGSRVSLAIKVDIRPGRPLPALEVVGHLTGGRVNSDNALASSLASALTLLV